MKQSRRALFFLERFYCSLVLKRLLCDMSSSLLVNTILFNVIISSSYNSPDGSFGLEFLLVVEEVVVLVV